MNVRPGKRPRDARSGGTAAGAGRSDVGGGQTFDQYRPLLFAIAYRMLGSVMDAEDIVQEAFLRWQAAAGDDIRSPRAFLSAVVTRLCIDQLRSAQAQREHYIGPWLPEPLVSEHAPDVEEAAMLQESLSLAFLVLLERLNPVERAVFLLHDVFDFDYAEIAPIVGKSVANCRQMARRARTRLADQRPRFEPSRAQQEQLTRQFMQACAEGDLPGLVALLADDITLWSDGGGQVAAAIRPIHGTDAVARFLLGIVRKAPPTYLPRPAWVNGRPGLVVEAAGRPVSVFGLDLVDGRIAAIRIIVTPDKLGGVGRHPRRMRP